MIWAGGVDPLGGVQRIREQSDDDLERIRALLVSWHDSLGSMPVTIADAIRHAEAAADLKDALASFCRSGRPEAKPLGYAFRKLAGRVVAGMVLRRSDQDRDKIGRWLVRSVEAEAGHAAGDAGDKGDAGNAGDTSPLHTGTRIPWFELVDPEQHVTCC